MASRLLPIEGRETGAGPYSGRLGWTPRRGSFKILKIKSLLAFQSERDLGHFGTGNRVQEKGRK
jgi:hypothetical protein